MVCFHHFHPTSIFILSCGLTQISTGDVIQKSTPPSTPGQTHAHTHQACLRYGTIPNISANPVQKTPQGKTLYHPCLSLALEYV